MQEAATSPGIGQTKGGSGFTGTQDLAPFGGRWSHGKGRGPIRSWDHGGRDWSRRQSHEGKGAMLETSPRGR